MKPEEIFAYEVLPLELREELRNESHSRLYILAKNSLRYLEENNIGRNRNYMVTY